MFLGGHQRINPLKIHSLLIVIVLINIAFISYCYANPVLLGRLLLPRLIGNVIAKRAATTEVATLTANSVSRMPVVIEGTATRLSTLSPSLSRTGNALNWLGLGYGLNSLHDDFFTGNNAPSVYRMYDAEGKEIYSSSPTDGLVTVYNQKKQKGELPCPGLECTFGELADTKFLPSTGTASGYYPATYKSRVTGLERTSKELFMVGVYPMPVFVQDGKLITADEKNTALAGNYPINEQDIADLFNELLMKAALQSDYQGMPFNKNNLVTAQEIKDLLKDQTITLSDLLESTKNNNNKEQVVIFPDTYPVPQPKPDTGKDIDMSHPDNSPPDLTPPSASEIISPLTDFFPFLKDFDLNNKDATCPIAEFYVFDNHYVIDNHCLLFEKIKDLLMLFSLIVWSFLGLRIVLSS